MSPLFTVAMVMVVPWLSANAADAAKVSAVVAQSARLKDIRYLPQVGCDPTVVVDSPTSRQQKNLRA